MILHWIVSCKPGHKFSLDMLYTCWPSLSIIQVYWFPVAAVTKYHKLDGLTQPKLIFSHFWRLETQNQGATLPLKIPGKNPSLPLPNFWWLTEILVIPRFIAASAISACHHMAFPVCLGLNFPLLTRTPVILDLGPTLNLA